MGEWMNNGMEDKGCHLFHLLWVCRYAYRSPKVTCLWAVQFEYIYFQETVLKALQIVDFTGYPTIGCFSHFGANLTSYFYVWCIVDGVDRSTKGVLYSCENVKLWTSPKSWRNVLVDTSHRITTHVFPHHMAPKNKHTWMNQMILIIIDIIVVPLRCFCMFYCVHVFLNRFHQL